MAYRSVVIGMLAAVVLAGCGSTAQNSASGATVVVTTPLPAATSGAATLEPAPTGAAEPTTAAEPTEATAPTVATDSTADSNAGTTSVSGIKIDLRLVASDFDQPLYLTNAGDGSGRVFVVEKPGRVVIVRDGEKSATPFLDITDRVGSNGSEQGLLSIAFDPQYTTNGRVFANYTNRDGDTVISRFGASGDTADPASEAILMTIEQPYANHNGGLVMFGPDGNLYIGMGDGGSGGDPQRNGQNKNSLLGKLLRIDVRGESYAIPADNPLVGQADARGEIWAWGLRNPWRFSFDEPSGTLYIADVGQNVYEEVNAQPANAPGLNYGWNITEGMHCYDADTCDSAGMVQPVAEYSHDFGCSVTGGYVYRGASFPALQGIYFYGDYCSGRVWAMRETAPGTWEQAEVLKNELSQSSFGVDEANELYLTSIASGEVYQIVGAE